MLPATAVARMEGRAAPAAAFLSPVAREYPSRALEGFFRPSRAKRTPARGVKKNLKPCTYKQWEHA